MIYAPEQGQSRQNRATRRGSGQLRGQAAPTPENASTGVLCGRYVRADSQGPELGRSATRWRPV